ncbi:MAG: hypothetical protein J6V40_00845, partial [Clostridia bacterium]|nr:hypothetical protein [Clostridia bacterium]
VTYSFTTPAVKGGYVVSAAAFASSSTIKANIDSVDGLVDLLLNANITIKYTNTSGSEQTVAVHDLNFISLSGMSQTSFALSGITGVKDNTTVSITLAAKDGVNNDLINFEVNDIASTETGDTQTITFTADPATTYVFDYDVINTTSEISLDSATKECLKNGSLSSIVVTVDGVATTWTKDNTSTIKALKDSTVSVEYFAAEHYAVSSTTITGVIATDNTFIAPATKQNITISATTRYTSNTITIDSVSNTKTLVDAGKIEVYVNSAALTDSTVIHTATAVTISAASLTNDEIASIVVTDGTNTYNSVDGVVTFTTAENLTYTITVVTTATENYVTVVYDESVTGVTINGVEYVDSEFEVEKLTDITIAPSTLANYKVTYITVTANGEEVEVDDLTFTGFKATKYIVTIYTICTDNIINIASDTITAIRNGSITSLIVNGETISNSNKSITVAKDSVISFAVTTNDYYLVDTITLDGVTLDVDTFTTTESTTYTLAVNIYDASNSIVFDGDENLSISVNDEYHYNKNSIPMNATVTLTVTPAKGEYIVEASLTGADATIDYVSSQAVITFTAGVDTDYVLAVTSAPIFSAVENNYVINQQDINLMVNGNDYARSVVYNGIWNNVFATTTDLTVDDVTFEYLAGHANINLIIYQWNIDIYTPIDEDVLLTKMDLCEYYRKYIKEVFGIEEILGTKITAAKIAEYITDEDADATLAGLTDFGSQETETIRLVFAGNDKYNATKLTNTVGAMDLRENATLDLNERVSIAYGSYLDNSAILELLLEGRLGVVSESGVHAFDYNPTLILSSDMVGKAAGEYAEITVTMPANYHYRKATATVTIEITKADISLEMTKSVVNYQLVLDGTLNKDYVIDFNPDIVIEDNDIDHIYFTMGLDLVNGELIARLDLSNMRTAGNAIEQGIMDTLIGSALKAIDPEGNGLTLSEFVDFSSTLGSLMGNEGINSDVSSLGSVSDLLQKVDDAIDIRIMIVFDDSDITPNNHGVYFVGAVTTDANYNMAIAAGYLVITAEIVNVDFVANGEANNIRKFEYDGTRKTMTAEAYDVNNAV